MYLKNLPQPSSSSKKELLVDLEYSFLNKADRCCKFWGYVVTYTFCSVYKCH